MCLNTIFLKLIKFLRLHFIRQFKYKILYKILNSLSATIVIASLLSLQTKVFGKTNCKNKKLIKKFFLTEKNYI